MLYSDDIPQLRARLVVAQQTLAALLAQDAPADTAYTQRIADLRAEVAEISAALRERGVAVDAGDTEASAASVPRTITTAGGAYAEGDLRQQGVFATGGTFHAPVIGVQTGGTIVIQSPQPTLSAQERRNRSRMLQKVRDFWITGVLENSLHGAALLALGIEARPAAVVHPFDLIVERPDRDPHPLPLGTRIAAVFDDLGGELLILGAPGGGKTTILLELARDLLDRAVQDETHPIPAVFNLSTWARQHLPLVNWLVDELNKRYDVPRTIAQAWVDLDAVLPLLDGLDEVALGQRTACVEAINTYHSEHGLLPLVACSRTADYEALAAKLRLRGAILIQPLTFGQIDSYLASTSAQLAALREAIQHDTALHELAETPLLLSVMTLAYQGVSQVAVEASGSLDAWREHLFAAYIQRMLDRPRLGAHYPPERTLCWLTWLARMLVLRARTIFFIERMQPQELLTRGQQRYHAFGVRMMVGLIGGLIFGLAVGAVDILTTGGEAAVAYGPLDGLIAGLIFGLVFGRGWGNAGPHRGFLQPILRSIRNALGIGLVVALVGGVAIRSILGLLSHGLVTFGLYGGIVGLVVGLIDGWDEHPGHITIVETIRWSWAKAWRSLKYTLIMSMPVGLLAMMSTLSNRFVSSLIEGLVFGFVGGVIMTLILSVITGLTTNEIERRIAPNQGIWRSARNGLWVGGLLLLTAGLTTGLLIELIYGLAHLGNGLLLALAYGSYVGLIVGLASALLYGGRACLQHLVLRILLWRSGAMPWNYAGFLEYAAERIFLHKVGGGYIFIHRMLMEYFAALPDGTAPVSMGERDGTGDTEPHSE